MIIIVMGVSGCGKTTIGRELARLAGLRFFDADDFHSDANKAKMAAGIPLDDADRQPWLLLLNAQMHVWQESGGGVLACSALKEQYRATLRNGLPPGAVRVVLLELPAKDIAARLAERGHAYMNPSLLPSQLATLEVPADALRAINDRPPDVVAGEILQGLQT